MQISIGKKDLMWSYAGTAISMASGFLTLPFLLVFLSADYLGLWYVFMAIGNLVVLIEFGFTPSFGRNIAYCWSGASSLTKEGCVHSDSTRIDAHLFAGVVYVCRDIYRIITAIAALILLVAATPYVMYVSSSLSADVVIASWVIFALSTLLNLYYLYYTSFLTGMGQIASLNKIKVVYRSFQLLASIIALSCGFGLVGLTVANLLGCILNRFISSIVFHKNPTISKLKLSSISVTKEFKKQVYSAVSYNAYKDGIVHLANYLSTQSMTILSSLFFGLSDTGAFSIALQLATTSGTVSLVAIEALTPMIQSQYQQMDFAGIRLAVGKGALAYLSVFFVCVIGVVVVIFPLLYFFKPELNLSIPLFLFMALYFFIFDWYSLFASVLAAMNTIPYMKSYILFAGIGILLGTLAVAGFGLGPFGLIFGMIVSQCIYNAWHWPKYLANKLRTTVFCILRQTLKKYITKQI